ncbi:MAG: hypothetical protein JKY52_06715 [Flavobacteriales bacterium]|nr:hypothetical protein [Flavobacteriales bacterium]
MINMLKGILFLLFILSAEIVFAQDADKDFSLGLRAGDPTGLTLKKYLGTNALELTIGSLLGDGDLSIFVHYLFHNPITSIGDNNDITGLDWYYGLGGQIKSFNGAVDLGGDGVLGLEYTFSEIPITVFLDAILYVEIIDNPLNIDLDAGIGARYNF